MNEESLLRAPPQPQSAKRARATMWLPLLNSDEAATAVICSGFLRRDVCCEHNFYNGDVKASSEPDVPFSVPGRERFPVGNDDGQPRSPIRASFSNLRGAAEAR